MSANPMTQELRRDLREACLAHDDPQAFAALEKILALDPHDENAQEQKKAIGKRLAEAHAEELAEVARQSDIVPMRQMVSMLRRWTDEGTLQRMEGYAVIAARVDAEQKARHRAELSKLMLVLLKTADIAAREQLAQKAERKAAEDGVDFTREELNTLEAVHAAFKQDAEARERARRVAELEEELSVLRADFKANLSSASVDDIAKTESRLSEIIVLLSGELSSAAPEALQKRAQRLHAMARGEQLQRRRIKATKAFVSAGAMGGLMLLIGFTAYCYAMVGDATTELKLIRTNKQTLLARECLNATFMPRIYCAIDEQYAAEHKNLKQWYGKLLQIRRDYRETMNKLRAFSSITPDNINDYLTQLDKLGMLVATAERDYGDSLGKGTDSIPPELIQPVTNCVKVLLATFDDIPADISKEEVVKRLQRMHSLQRRFKDETRVDISMIPDMVNRYRQVLRTRLNKLAETDLDGAVSFYRRYEGELELPNDWAGEWEKEKNRRLSIEQKIKSLRNCSSLRVFVDTVREIRSAKPELSNCCEETLLIRIADEGQGAVLRHRINQMKEKAELPKDALKNPRELAEMLDTAYGIFKNKDSVYAGHYTHANNRAIENMYEPLYRTKRPLFVINDVNGEYVAVCEHKSSGDLIHMLDANEHELDYFTFQNGKRIRLNTKTHLETMGISRSSLQRGSMTPADVLIAIASYNKEDFPTYARVYLFRLAVAWVDSLPAINSGKAFSPALRKDLKAFKEKAARENIGKGCWFTVHRTADVAAWKNFFVRISRAKYNKEIVSNLQELHDVQPELAGYIDEKGAVVTLRGAQGRLGYFREQGDHLVIAPVPNEPLPCFTPLFLFP